MELTAVCRAARRSLLGLFGQSLELDFVHSVRKKGQGTIIASLRHREVMIVPYQP
jgi:hypothetical protein